MLDTLGRDRFLYNMICSF